MSRKIQFICLLVFVGLFLAATQPGFAQSSNGPLNFGNNYFVTGDYVVGGAQGMTINIANGYAGGTITIPDANPGITGAKSIPPGAEVVAALLYWQTVEKSTTVPGQSGSGENGYFMPVVAGGPKAPGYPITGVNLASSDTVAYSSTGCTSTSTGEVVRTYRANVLAALPRDSTGNISANGIYAVYLPSVRNSTPLTLGATLVLVYRILSPSVPLNSIVIYDGAYAPSTSSLTMKQTVQGFYDAASSPVSRVTQIVGQGKSSKVETVYLNNTALPSLYGIEPAFPGYYGTWDNPTWTFNPTESYMRVPNPILAGAASATTEVVPKSSGEGCVSWGAVIVSTTVLSSDGDGLLDAWKVKPAGYANPGYCDASVSEGVCIPGSASWVDLPGAVHGEKDVFIQLDYMCSSPTGGDSCTTGDGTNYSFDPRLSGAVNLVTSAFAPASTSVHSDIHLHINPIGTNQPDIHAIPEQACTDILTTSPEELCSFPGQPGVVAWKGGFDFIKNQLVDPSVSTSDSVSACTVSSPPSVCVPRFQPGKRTSWHYVLSAHAVGQPEWKLQNDSLESVKQSGNTVTFTTATAVGTLNNVSSIPGNFLQDPSCPDGRVTILGAATNPSLNGTFCLKSAAASTGTTFTITVGGASTTASYTYYTDPNLAVAPGFTSSASGVSDVGGADSLITLGLWGNPAFNGSSLATSPVSDGQSEPVLAGTFMHELGHSIGLTHGGYTYAQLALGSYVPTLEPNCKPNFQSVMNYAFQVDLLAPSNGGSNNVPDYSGQVLASLNEAKAGAAGVLTGASYLDTYWYAPYTGVGSPVTIHCDGSPNTNGAEMSLSTGLSSTLSWSADQDINFDGNKTETLQGYNDWANIDLRQIGATGTNSTAEGGGQNFGGGGQNFGGGGQNFGGGGQNLGGGGQNFGGGGQNLGGGGQNFGGGGQNFGGGGEVSAIIANSVTRPPQNLTATEAAAPRAITLRWSAPSFGQIGAYNVYRAVKGGAFAVIGSVTGNPPVTTYTDTTAACNSAGYEYFVTAVLSSTSANPGQQSVGSNTVTTGSNGTTGQGPLTGCYTNTPPTVALTNLSVTSAPVVQGSPVPITWSLQDDYNTTAAYVNNLPTNSLVAIGPFPSDGGCPATLPSRGTVTPLLTNGIVQSGAGASSFIVSAGPNYQFTFNWDTTPFNAGCYFFTLTLDSTQTETTTSPLTVLIYVSDSSPHVTTTTLPAGVVGKAYSNTIYEAGGVSPFTWTYTGSLPSGITLDAGTGMLSGTSCVAGSYNFTAKVTDSKSNYGTQGLMLQIQQATATTSVGSSLNASTYGQAVTFTATVTPQYGCTPTGTVTFYDGGTAISAAITLSNASAMFTTTALQFVAATHSITAVYSGDSNFYATNVSGSTATALSQKVTQAATTTSVISALNPSTYGQAVTFAATVAPQYAGTPTGTVTFYDGATPISSAIPLSGSATAMFTTNPLQLVGGPNSIIAVYSGDSNFYATGTGGSTATVLPQNVNQATTTTSVTSSLSSPFTYGQVVTFTAMVAPQYAGTPTGSVTFKDGGVALAGVSTVTLSGGMASFSTTANQLMAGTHSITAVYSGDPNFYATGAGGSTAAALPQVVNPAPLTATVSGNESSAPPTFTVSVISYSAFAGTDTASSAVNGTLTCDVVVPAAGGTPGSNPITCTGLSAANYDITYDYSGLAPIVAATPATLTVNVSGTVVTGAPNTFTVASYTLSGLLTPDTSSVVTGMLTCTVLALDASNNYPISCTGLSTTGASNSYNIVYSYSYGASSATPPTPLTVAVNGSLNSSGPTPTFTINSLTYSGFVNTDTLSVVSGTLSCTVGPPPSVTSNYPIKCLGLTASNYDVSYDYTSSPQTAAATPAPLIVNVTGTNPTTTYSLSGLVNGNVPTVVTGTISCTKSTTADTSGNYPISCSGLSATNYSITYSYSPGLGPKSVASAPLSLAVSGTVPSSGALPTLTITSVTYTGFINGDTLSAITGTLSCTLAPRPSTASPYKISSCTGLMAPGYYNFYYLTGTITAVVPD